MPKTSTGSHPRGENVAQEEDHILYPMADGLLLPEDQQALEEAFERVEREEIGRGVHEKYYELAQRLAKG